MEGMELTSGGHVSAAGEREGGLGKKAQLKRESVNP
jgi:hypothetical protein